MKEVSLVKNYTPKEYQQHASCPHSQISKNKMVLGISFAIITFYMVVEFLGGYWFNSLTLMADAGHMANDSLSIFLAWIGLFLSLKWQKWLALGCNTLAGSDRNSRFANVRCSFTRIWD